MNKKLFIALAAIGIIIVIGGGFFLFKLKSPLKPPQTQPPSIPKKYTVTYNGAIFDPTPLVIKAADTVDFINKSENPVWVASDPHSIHTNLPGFDALTVYGFKQIYSYTFIKKGAWGYHNHLNPIQRGAVVVE